MDHDGSRRSLPGNATSAYVRTVSKIGLGACRGRAQKMHPGEMGYAALRSRAVVAIAYGIDSCVKNAAEEEDPEAEEE